jgi:RHS repeat-associated protein
VRYTNNKQISAITANPKSFIDMAYTYDKEDNPLSTVLGHRPSNSEQYSYDIKNQLSQYKKGSNQQTVYNYDPVGNRTSVTAQDGNATYTANNMNAYLTISQSSAVDCIYDANGNMLSDGTRTFSYDVENRLVAVDDGTTAVYSYDALGRRIKKVVGNSSVSFLFDGIQAIEERNAFDSLLATNVWGVWVDDIINRKAGSDEYYYHANATGSVIAITNSAGVVSERYDYDAFGKVSFYNSVWEPLSQSTIGNNYTYAGRELDQETGNYYYRARHYNAAQGRFLQRDPIGIYGGDVNFYSYVKNNPIKLIDPLGLKPEDEYNPWIENPQIQKIIEDIRNQPNNRRPICLSLVGDRLSGGATDSRRNNRNYLKHTERFGGSAKDAGPFLKSEGLEEVYLFNYEDLSQLQVGDIQIIQNVPGTEKIHGHIQVYLGNKKFYPDYGQPDLYPHSVYRLHKPKITNYRFRKVLNPYHPEYEIIRIMGYQ